MAQTHVSREDLLKMRVGSTRVFNLEDKTKLRIKQDLSKKGISSEDIEKAFMNMREEGFCQDELSQAKKLLSKRGYDPENPPEKEELARLYAYLCRKGFSSETVKAALDIF